MRPSRTRVVDVLLTSRRASLRAAAGLAALAALVVTAAPAQAAYPGTNGRILFTEHRGFDAYSDLWSAGADGTDPRLLIKNASNGTYSADGTKIAFLRPDSSYALEVWVANADGTGQSQITTGNPTGMTPTNDNSLGPSISPDGTTVAFTSRLSGDQGGIYVVPSDGSSPPRQLTTGQSDGEPAFSPDGQQIAFASARDSADPDTCLGYLTAPDGTPCQTGVFVMNADGTNVHAVADGGSDHRADSPDWSPDGTQLVYVRYSISGSSDSTSDEDGVRIVDADGAGNHLVYAGEPGADLDSNPNRVGPAAAFSPDGTKLLWNGADDDWHGTLVIGDPSGDTPTRVPAAVSSYPYTLFPHWGDSQYVPPANPQGTVTLTPSASELFTGQKETITGVLSDSGQPLKHKRILITVGGVNKSRTVHTTTNASGGFTFSYVGSQPATGTDTDSFSACWDNDADGVCDTAEPAASTTITWAAQPRMTATSATLPATGSPSPGPVAIKGNVFCLGSSTGSLTVTEGSKKTAVTFKSTGPLQRTCDEDSSYSSGVSAAFDEVTGTANGKVNGVAGYTLTYHLEDHGSSGDVAQVTVSDGGGNTVFSASGPLASGELTASQGDPSLPLN